MGEISNSTVTSQRFNKWWCPSVCPITLLPFFMWIEHPEEGWLPTYGGPFDSYTIPEPDLENGTMKKLMDIEYSRMRFDHDEGGWVDGCEVVGQRVVGEQQLFDWNAWDETKKGGE